MTLKVTSLSINPSASLQSPPVQQCLVDIQPVEQLLDVVLHIVHPELWTANSAAMRKLIQELPGISWPTLYSRIDIIVNRITPPHVDAGGASSFYDYLLSLGQGHSATLDLEDLDAWFAYPLGTSVFLTGRVLTHSVPHWIGGERVVIAHYSKDDVLDRLGIARPALPTNLSWWNLHGGGA
jgi:hypothetical protein